MSYGIPTIYDAATIRNSDITNNLDESGFVVIRNVLSSEFIATAKKELSDAILKETEYHHTNEYKDYGMVMLCAIYGGSFIKLLNIEKLISPFNVVMGEGCIMYAYTSSSMPPMKTNYSNRIHVDSPRLIPGYLTNMGATILLDDFTEENGATWFLPKSHAMREEPSNDYFYSNACRLIAPAGTVWFFNARLWHAGGNNQTDRWRHALTINMCRPYMKQRIDIPRAISHLNVQGFSEMAKQKLGFYAQVPASLDEYYLPPDQRKFKQKAE